MLKYQRSGHILMVGAPACLQLCELQACSGGTREGKKNEGPFDCVGRSTIWAVQACIGEGQNH